jgi:hypothetical protein
VCNGFYSERVLIIVGFLILVMEGTPKYYEEDSKVKVSLMPEKEANTTVVSGMRVLTLNTLFVLPYVVTVFLLRPRAKVHHIKWQLLLLFSSSVHAQVPMIR